MTWADLAPLARGGQMLRRKAWSADPARSDARIFFSAGAGTTRTVAVYRLGAAEAVVTTADFAEADFLADDWELAS